MMRFGDSFKPLKKAIEYVGTAHGVSSKEFHEEFERVKRAQVDSNR